VAPQKPEFDKLWPTERETVNAILRDVEKAYAVHPHQRYLTGLSQGGHGTIALAKRLVWDFAAIAPVCGWSEDPTAAAKDLADMPLWAFHGEKDQAVKPEGSKDLVAALEKLGAHPKLTLYPELGHNCWDAAYRDAGLAEWFLSHTL
ncbi:MAG: prolyl oligopeptidase family serine peptidase, partial [Nitrospirae bacterium]|nr:prolyl oligopeptidase family serine peptidase [Fimbriimonadaceae bacterium]